MELDRQQDSIHAVGESAPSPHRTHRCSSLTGDPKAKKIQCLHLCMVVSEKSHDFVKFICVPLKSIFKFSFLLNF